VARRKPARAPRMRRRIYQPGEMQAHDGAQENAPEHEGKPAESEKRYSQRNNRNIVILRNPDVKLVLGQVGNVAGQSGRVVVHGLAHQNPAHMRPPLSISWGMRVAFLVRMLVVNSMCGHPENGAAFESKSRAHGKEIFEPAGRLVSAMSEQAVVADANSQARGDPPQYGCHGERFPGE